MYKVYYEASESEPMDIGDIFYLVKNYRLIEVALVNGYAIRQRKDMPITLELNGETIDIDYWTVYCTSWNKIIENVWTWRGEDELKQYIEACEQF